MYKLLNIIDNDKIYTFNQILNANDKLNIRKGNNISWGHIDSAMFIIPYKLYKNVNWSIDKYEADYIYISQCYQNNKNLHIYVDNDLSYYNKILF